MGGAVGRGRQPLSEVSDGNWLCLLAFRETTSIDMGEAKRKRNQEMQQADALAGRVQRGDFGAPPAADGYLVLLDKSAQGTSALAALRAAGGSGLAGMEELFEAAPFRLWQASSLFGYTLLCGGAGSAEERTLLAADEARLLEHALPRALRRLAALGRPPGVVWGVDPARRRAIEAAAYARPELAALTGQPVRGT